MKPLFHESESINWRLWQHCKVRTKWNFQSWTLIFQIKFLFLVLSFQKHIALVYFLRRIEAIHFWKPKIRIKIKIIKKNLGNAWNLDFHGVKKVVTHFVTQFTHVPKHFGVYGRKPKKIVRENCFKNQVSDLKKNVLCVNNTTFRKKCKN